MFKKATLEIYNIDVEDIITTSVGDEEVTKDPDPNAGIEDEIQR